MKSKQQYGLLSNYKFMIKKIIAFDKTLLWLIPIPMISTVLISVIGIYLPKIVIDQLMMGDDITVLLQIIVAITIILLLLRVFYTYSANMVMGKAMSTRISLVTPLLQKSIATDYENIASKQGQEMMRRALDSVQSNTSGTEVITMATSDVIRNLGGLIVFGIILAALNPMILLFLVLGAIITIVVTKRANVFEHKYKDQYVPIDDQLFYLREQCVDVTVAKDVRIYSMAEWLINKFDGLIRERYYWYKKVELKKYTPKLVDGFIMFLRDGLAYSYLIYQVLNGMEVGNFVLYFGAITGFSLWLTNVTEGIGMISRASLHVTDLRSYLDMKDYLSREPSKFDITGEPLEISLEDISFGYDKKLIIQSLDMTIKPGQKIAVVGPNGAGKTTLIKLICGLLRPLSGSIKIGGVHQSDYHIEDYYSLFSVAFQDAYITAFTIGENVSMLPEGEYDEEMVFSVLDQAGLLQKVESLPKGIHTNISNIFTDEGVELSGGEKQKLILARALYKDAPIMILDEPTAALDPIAEAELYSKYHSFAQNKTSIYISHRLSSTRFCDVIMFFENGEIQEYGTHDELMNKQGKYADMFEIQSHYYKEENNE